MSETTRWPYAKWPIVPLRFTFLLPVFSVMKATQTTERGVSLRGCVCVCVDSHGKIWFAAQLLHYLNPSAHQTCAYIYDTKWGGSGQMTDMTCGFYIKPCKRKETDGSHDQTTSAFDPPDVYVLFVRDGDVFIRDIMFSLFVPSCTSSFV